MAPTLGENHETEVHSLQPSPPYIILNRKLCISVQWAGNRGYFEGIHSGTFGCMREVHSKFTTAIVFRRGSRILPWRLSQDLEFYYGDQHCFVTAVIVF